MTILTTKSIFENYLNNYFPIGLDNHVAWINVGNPADEVTPMGLKRRIKKRKIPIVLLYLF
jgi:hypothetical protein